MLQRYSSPPSWDGKVEGCRRNGRAGVAPVTEAMIDEVIDDVDAEVGEED